MSYSKTDRDFMNRLIAFEEVDLYDFYSISESYDSGSIAKVVLNLDLEGNAILDKDTFIVRITEKGRSFIKQNLPDINLNQDQSFKRIPDRMLNHQF